jgi:RNA polymerase sigma factor (sigma-70 family)
MSIFETYSDEDLAEFMKMAILESSESDYAEAFVVLFKRYKDYLLWISCQFAKKMKLPDSMAEDIHSEFFTKFCWGPKSKILYFNIPTSKSKKPFLSWMIKILQRVALDMAKKYHEHKSHEILWSEEKWNEFCLHDEELSSTEPISTPERTVFEEVFHALKDRDRDIIREYYVRKPILNSQRSPKGVYDEIGEIVNTSRESVKQVIKRFNQAVKERLSPQ